MTGTGKVFSKSANIYQDQAKVLFDYYKSAAQAIVSAEMAEEQNMTDLVRGQERAQSKQKTYKIVFPICFGMALVGLVLTFAVAPALCIFAVAGVVAGIIFFVNYSKMTKETAYYGKEISESDNRYKNIRREYKVDKIGVVYVPVATRVPFEDKSFLIDNTGVVNDTGFNLNVLHKPEEFQQAIQGLTEAMDALPIVETNNNTTETDTSDYSTSVQRVKLNDYVGNIDKQVNDISYLLSDSDDVSVNMPIIMPDSKDADFIREYAADSTGGIPVVNVFNVDFQDKINKFTSLNALKDQIKNSDENDSNEYMKKLMRKVAESVQIFTKIKNASSSKLVQYTSDIFANVLKSAYTEYSPSLEAEEIERIRSTDFNYQTAVNDYSPFTMKTSSRVKYDIFSNNWVAEDGSRTSLPFGMHQIDEEILMPVITSLMEENRIERLRIYNNIEDQKRGYLERWSSETGNYFRDNRKSADELITHMREAYADYMGAYNMYKSLQDTSTLMKETKNIEDAEVKEVQSEEEMVAAFAIQAKQCNDEQQAFSDFMDRIQEDISESTNEFAHIEYYEGSLRDTMPKDIAVAMANVMNVDERHKQLINVSPYIASYGELPPAPFESEEMEEDVRIDLDRQVRNAIEQLDEENSKSEVIEQEV